jgi:peptidoglycan/xylan/chitin deacetylase (PgdA/CDA1 family)
VDDRLAERLARRRLDAERRARRRRLVGVAVALATVFAGAIVFGLTRDGEESQPVADTPGASAGAATVKPDSGGERGAETGGARPDESWRPSGDPVPILMYHVIGEPAGEVAYPDLYLSVADFREQVDWLERNGYTAVTLDQVQDAWYDGATLPPKPVVLSFDDGYLGQYLDAMPILREKGWGGLLNLKSEGSDLSSNQVRKMIRAGWEVASHTVTHPDLTTIDDEQLERELVDSRRTLQQDLGAPIDNFCYPAGQYDERVAAAVEAAGYRGATTVEPGLAERGDPFELRRIRINFGFGADDLASALGAA